MAVTDPLVHKPIRTEDPIMYQHVTRFIDDIERGIPGSEIEAPLTHALYDPQIVDVNYRETLAANGLEGTRIWDADIESLNLEATVALLTFAHRADYSNGGGLMGRLIDNRLVYRILLRLRELDEGWRRPTLIPFWRESGPLGCCSNWYPADFDFRGTRFATSEHWMMWQKARVMGDFASADAILCAPHPRDAKDLGAKVAPYDGALWDAVREQLVYYGVREKFLQNERERNLLLATGSAVLCEASPYDRIWGIGLGAGNPDHARVEKWRGRNLQGRVCMRVRADLRSGADAAFTGEDAVRELLESQIGGMTLLELSRVPAARMAVPVYAQVAAHASGSDLSPDEWLAKEAVPLRELAPAVPSVAWDETLAELALQWKLRRL